MSSRNVKPTAEKLKWHAAFNEQVAALLDRTLMSVDSVAHETEVLSQDSRYSRGQSQTMNVHSFYLKESRKLHQDFTTKAEALIALRNEQPPADTGLTVQEYERMIESRLKEIVPVLETMIEADKHFQQDARSAIAMRRKTTLLQNINELLEFFRTAPEPSSWMKLTASIAENDLPGAETALDGMSASARIKKKERI